jgi:DNA-binding NtrC family response regulator
VSGPLVLVSEALAGGELELPAEGTLVLGRAGDCDVVVDHPTVSSRHARLELDGVGARVGDLDSGNGTHVNGVEVDAAPLKPGDELRLGDAVLRLGRRGTFLGAAPQGTVRPGADRALLDAVTALLADREAQPTELLERMLDHLLEAFGADRGVVFLPGPGGHAPAARRLRPEADGSQAPSQSLVARVAREGRALLLTSAETEELRQEIRSIAGQIRSIVVAPFEVAAGRAVLYLDSALDRRRFEAGDEDTLAAFGVALREVLARRAEAEALARREERRAEARRREAAGRRVLGSSPAMEAVLTEVAKAARAEVSVLVTGESGTGKELVARELHAQSERSQGPFVAVNCAAIPAELVESELFGSEKGAYTGATARRLGYFELADGGTLFLDEVGELPLAVQAKLLRALQERQVRRLGGSKPVPVDFRLVSATNVDLPTAVQAGTFREDVYYRLAVFQLRLPPLRERADDVLLLARAFLETAAREFRRTVRDLAPETAELLRAHPWPGNVRELRNVIEQAVVREEGAWLAPASVAPALGAALPGPPAPVQVAATAPPSQVSESFPDSFEEARRAFETRFLVAKIRAEGGNMKATAARIGLSRKALYAKCSDYGIDYKAIREED